ncbi:Zinc finger SWIM domain-containing protein 3 [Nymphon striatum]|nr:Zinc finger SWIM domain-containing protein 3 [Nymphon striatum]
MDQKKVPFSNEKVSVSDGTTDTNTSVDINYENELIEAVDSFMPKLKKFCENNLNELKDLIYRYPYHQKKNYSNNEVNDNKENFYEEIEKISELIKSEFKTRYKSITDTNCSKDYACPMLFTIKWNMLKAYRAAVMYASFEILYKIVKASMAITDLNLNPFNKDEISQDFLSYDIKPPDELNSDIQKLDNLFEALLANCHETCNNLLFSLDFFASLSNDIFTVMGYFGTKNSGGAMYCPNRFADWEDVSGQQNAGRWRQEGESRHSGQRLSANNLSRNSQVIRDSFAQRFEADGTPSQDILLYNNYKSNGYKLHIDGINYPQEIISELGILWNSKSDEIYLKTNNISVSKYLTKREIIRKTCSFYDPLGLFSPVHIKAKIFMQMLWKKGFQWDEILPQDIIDEWKTIEYKLIEVPEIKNNRISPSITFNSRCFTDNEETLLAIAFQTEEMRNTFAAFPELLLIDGTCKLNDLRMSLYVLMNVDGNSESEVICLWLVATEDRNTISNLMDKFKKRNSKWTDINVIMSDKDMTERDVLTEKLPGAEILICLFHTLRSFRREVSTEKLGISSGERNMCLEMLGKITHAKSEDGYQNLYDDFLRSAPRSVLDYYNHNWHDIRDQWVEGLKNNKANFMNSTNNGLESTNQKLKSVISRYSGVTVFFQDLMKCSNSLKNERDHLATNVVLKTPIHRVAISETEQAYEDLLTPFAFKYVKQQLQFSLNTTIVGRVDDRSTTVKTTSLGNIVVFVDSCECSFFTSMLLPCRHVFGVRRHLNLPLFDESLCALRWTVHYYKSSQRVYQQRPAQPGDSNSAGGSITLQVQGGERTRNVLSEQQKYRKAHFLMITIAQIISEQGTRDFEYNMQVLNSLKDYLQERKKVVITEIVKQTVLGATAEGDIASTILGFMISFVGNKDIVCLFPVKKLNANELEECCLAELRLLDDIGYNVVAISVDNHPVNRSYFVSKLCEGNLKLQVANPVNGAPLFLLFEAVHSMKNIFNNFEGKKVVCYPNFDDPISNVLSTAKFEHMIDLYDMEVPKPIKMEHKLLMKCLCPRNIEKLSVKLALAVFHESTVYALRYYCQSENKEWVETADHVDLVITLWSIINVKTTTAGSHKRDEARKPITSKNDWQLSFLIKFANFLAVFHVNKRNCLSKQTYLALIGIGMVL